MFGTDKKFLVIVIVFVILGGCKSGGSNTSSEITTGYDIEVVDNNEFHPDRDEVSSGIDAIPLDVILNEEDSEVNNDNESKDQIITDIVTRSLDNKLFAVGENIVISEGQSIVLNDLLSNDFDEASNELHIESFSQSINGGVVELIDINTLKYIPASDFHGIDKFTYVIADKFGYTANASVNILIEKNNDMPQIIGKEIIISEDESVLLLGLIIDDMNLGGNGSTIQNFSQGEEGGVELLNSNVLKYTPALNFHGFDSFTYSVLDAKDELSTATVNIEIKEVNDLPDVLNEVVTILEDQSIVLNNLLSNDTDVDEDILILENFEQSINSGLVELTEDGSLRYVPAKNFFGTDSFNYSVSDGRGGVSMGTVTIVVSEVNDIPVAKVDFFSVVQGLAVEVDILENDQGMGDDISLSFVSLPQYGSIELTANGKVVYTPQDEYSGQDSFVYQIKDEDGETSVATVSLDINCVDSCNHMFSISWEPSVSVDIVAYKVYYGNDAGNLSQVVELDNVTNYEHFVDIKGEYFFAVSAVNDQNVESELTGIVSGVF